VLARIEKLEGVLDAWTDRSGTRIVVSIRAQTAIDQTVAAVSSALAPRYRAEEVSGREAEDAVRACHAGSPDWFRASEVGALSREEARVLALRWARTAAESAGLDAGRLDTFERLVREALTRAFPESEGRDEPDLGAFRERSRRELEGVVRALDLPRDQAARLREALEAEWRRATAPRRADGDKRWF
jgi:hypothetical protein